MLLPFLGLGEILTRQIHSVVLQRNVSFVFLGELLAVYLRYESHEFLNRNLEFFAQLLTIINSKVSFLEDTSSTAYCDKIDGFEVEGGLDQYKSIHLFQNGQR
jgi:hypothetical protein